MNSYTVVFARRLIATAVLLFTISFCSSLRAQQGFHGAAILKNPVGPDGTPRAHVGDTITATITVMNLDDFLDTVTLSNIFDVVHHASGDVTTANLLPFPLLTLDSYLVFGGT